MLQSDRTKQAKAAQRIWLWTRHMHPVGLSLLSTSIFILLLLHLQLHRLVDKRYLRLHSRDHSAAAALRPEPHTMAPKQKYQLTPEQEAAAEEKRRLRAAAKANQQNQVVETHQRGTIVGREYLPVNEPAPEGARLTIMTWNVRPRALVFSTCALICAY